MFNIVLYQPEIPYNTGAAIRLCANAGFKLHLIRPLGFDFEDKKLRRAGLDYHEFVNVIMHDSFQDYQSQYPNSTIYACTTHGKQRHDLCHYKAGDTLLFGPETRGLPKPLLDDIQPEFKIRVPMLENSRSLNLANTVAIISYEAWRQVGFAGVKFDSK